LRKHRYALRSLIAVLIALVLLMGPWLILSFRWETPAEPDLLAGWRGSMAQVRRLDPAPGLVGSALQIDLYSNVDSMGASREIPIQKYRGKHVEVGCLMRSDTIPAAELCLGVTLLDRSKDPEAGGVLANKRVHKSSAEWEVLTQVIYIPSGADVAQIFVGVDLDEPATTQASHAVIRDFWVSVIDGDQ
jgi:hypothetical protein